MQRLLADRQAAFLPLKNMEKYIWIYVLVGAALIGVLIYTVVTSKKRRKAKILARVRARYGVLPQREYTEEEMHRIRTYFDMVHDEDDYFVDDITWNDLDLDLVFMAMNHTFSSVGEETLYDMLREPVFDEAELRERARLIDFFSENSRVREELEMAYAAVGRTKKYALVEYLRDFRTMELEPGWKPVIHMLLWLIPIGVFFYSPAIGIVALLTVLIVNIYTYYKEKGKVEPYYVSLSAMAYLVNASEAISGVNAPELKAYMDMLKEETAPVRNLRKNLKWLGSGKVLNSGMDFAQILIDYLRMMTHADFLVFNRMVNIVRNHEENILHIMQILGYLEALIAVSSYRQTIPFYCTGTFSSEKNRGMTVKNAYHPLIKEPVANSIDEEKSVLITGSNASGKSTFLRTTALAALMAESVATVHAMDYEAPFYRIFSSMALRDDIQSSESYYIVEIKSLKRIMDRMQGEVPVLCFVDEVLRGTNTVERISASSQILKNMSEDGAFVFAATHDIELTHLLENFYANYHFEEEVEDKEIRFNYLLKKGRATTRNAIRLLGIMGYDGEVIEKAEETAKRFTEEGVWELL